MKSVFENFNSFLRYRPKCEAKWNLIKTFKFVTNCKDWRWFTKASDIGIQKRLNFLVSFLLTVVNTRQWHEHLYYVNTNLHKSNNNYTHQRNIYKISEEIFVKKAFQNAVLTSIIAWNIVICLMRPKRGTTCSHE